MSSYFRFFSNIKYPFNKDDGTVEYIEMVDIVKNVRFLSRILSTITLYEEYQIQDGDTPEIIAHKIYGDTNLHWVIMLSNLKFNIWNDFPLSDSELYDMCVERYGEGNLDLPKIVHGKPYLLDRNGVQVDANGQFLDGYLKHVQNYDYEVMKNDQKRLIKIIHPSYISQIKAEFESRMLNG